MSSISIKKNDKVLVLSGDDKGKNGTVISVLKKSGMAIVSDVNVAKKAVKDQSNNKNFESFPRPIYLSKIKLVKSADTNNKVVKKKKK